MKRTDIAAAQPRTTLTADETLRLRGELRKGLRPGARLAPETLRRIRTLPLDLVEDLVW